MVELLRSNDLALISYATALLKESGIEVVCLDEHTSAMEGSILAVRRRLMVAAVEAARAQALMAEAGIACAPDGA
jgi:hypothetical protein